MSDLATIFRKDPEQWTKDDVARVVSRYRELKLAPKAFDPKTGERKQKKPRKRKVDPRQVDLEDLL
jgi:hypothetical protein